MEHDHDLGTALERGPIAGLLVASVAAIALVADHAQAESLGDRHRVVATRVVDEDDLVRHARRDVPQGALDGPRRVVRGHDDDHLSRIQSHSAIPVQTRLTSTPARTLHGV